MGAFIKGIVWQEVWSTICMTYITRRSLRFAASLFSGVDMIGMANHIPVRGGVSVLNSQTCGPSDAGLSIAALSSLLLQIIKYLGWWDPRASTVSRNFQCSVLIFTNHVLLGSFTEGSNFLIMINSRDLTEPSNESAPFEWSPRDIRGNTTRVL